MRKRPMMLGSDNSSAMVPMDLCEVVTPIARRAARIVVYQSKNGFRWRLVGGNGERIASGESHSTKSNARRAARTMQRAAAEAEIING